MAAIPTEPDFNPPAPPRTVVVDPQPVFPFGVARIVRVPDPFHDDAFKGTPAEGHGAKGDRRLEWWCEDFAGNLVARWSDHPPCPFGDNLCEVQHHHGEWTWVRKDLPVFGKLTGVVLEPGGEFTVEQIRAAARAYVSSEPGAPARQHVMTPGVSVLESWVAPEDTTIEGAPIRAGAWVMRVAVHDEKLWAQLKNDWPLRAVVQVGPTSNGGA